MLPMGWVESPLPLAAPEGSTGSPTPPPDNSEESHASQSLLSEGAKPKNANLAGSDTTQPADERPPAIIPWATLGASPAQSASAASAAGGRTSCNSCRTMHPPSIWREKSPPFFSWVKNIQRCRVTALRTFFLRRKNPNVGLFRAVGNFFLQENSRISRRKPLETRYYGWGRLREKSIRT